MILEVVSYSLISRKKSSDFFDAKTQNPFKFPYVRVALPVCLPLGATDHHWMGEH